MALSVTIRTTDDILRALDTHPEWLEAVRSRVLTEELLTLPRKMARLTERMLRLEEGQTDLAERQADLAERMLRLEEGQTGLAERQADLAERQADLAERMLRLEEGQADLAERMLRLEEGQTGLAERQADLAERQADLAERMLRLEEGQMRLGKEMRLIANRLGEMSGYYTERVAKKEASLLVRELGLRYVRTLTSDELIEMSSALTTYASHEDVKSFCRADMILAASDAEGQTWYVAAEASYTADERDTSRALRNADYMTHLTQCPARAAITAVKIDDRIQGVVQKGQVHWYVIVPDQMTTA